MNIELTSLIEDAIRNLEYAKLELLKNQKLSSSNAKQIRLHISNVRKLLRRHRVDNYLP